MPQTAITLTSLGGVDLNPGGGAYQTQLFGGQIRTNSPERQTLVQQRTGRGPGYAGATFDLHTVKVWHYVPDDASHEANLATLKKLYDPNKGAQTLIYTDGDAVAKKLTVVARRIVLDDRSSIGADGLDKVALTGEWDVLDIVALANAAEANVSGSKSASPATISVVNAGNVETVEATIALTPTAAKAAGSGQRYIRRITPIWRVPRPARRYPVNLTDATAGLGWDHAAEVTATRSQADGDDVEVYVNQRRVERWFGTVAASTAANKATSHLWINLDHPPERHWTYNGGSTLADNATTLAVREPLVNMPPTPFVGAFVTGTTVEAVFVSGYDAENGTLTIARGKRGTSATTWADGSLLYHCPVLIDLVYGGTSLAAAPIDNGNKPMVLENTTTASNNGSLVYSHFMESESAADLRRRKARTGAWHPKLLTEDYERREQWWKGWQPRTATLTTDATPASKMAIAWRGDGPLAGHPAADSWEWTGPCGLTKVTITADATTIEGTIPETAFEEDLEIIGIDRAGVEELLARWNANDAGSGTHTATDLTPTANIYAVRIRIAPYDPDEYTIGDQGAIKPSDGDGWTADDVTLTVSTSEEPLFFWGARADAYQFGRPGAAATIANVAGDTVELHGLVCALNEVVSLDPETQRVTLTTEGAAFGVQNAVAGTVPPLPSGTNNLTLTETGIGTVTFACNSLYSAWIL